MKCGMLFMRMFSDSFLGVCVLIHCVIINMTNSYHGDLTNVYLHILISLFAIGNFVLAELAIMSVGYGLVVFYQLINTAIYRHKRR